MVCQAQYFIPSNPPNTIETLGRIDLYNLGALVNFFPHSSTGFDRPGSPRWMSPTQRTNFPVVVRQWIKILQLVVAAFERAGDGGDCATNGNQINTAFVIKIQPTPIPRLNFPAAQHVVLQLCRCSPMACWPALMFTACRWHDQNPGQDGVTNALVSYFRSAVVRWFWGKFRWADRPNLAVGPLPPPGCNRRGFSSDQRGHGLELHVCRKSGEHREPSDLVSPVVALPAGQAQLTFRNNYDPGRWRRQ